MTSDRIINVTDDSFENDVLKASQAVLVDFWAPWCGPCKQIAPILDEVADEMPDKITIAKINIDDNPNTPGKYGVRGIPTTMLFRNGTVQGTKVGAMSKAKLVEFIIEHLD
ncbi:MAG: thioredoxin TrxA [Mariprofundaceae bacterium]